MALQPEPRGSAAARYRVVIKGVVQGVGFRPYVHNLALALNIKGSVKNSAGGVIIEAEGIEKNVKLFLDEIKENPPELSVISDCQRQQLPVCGYKTFEILPSEPGAVKEAMVPPDVATCRDCKRDIFNPKGRHYLYPFTNCTNCGPRFTIIKEVPYDRPDTTMASFHMCGGCAREYHCPDDRRFHAQPAACPDCGPRMEVVDCSGKPVAGSANWLEVCWDIIGKGEILAVKSLGGFHLACDARNKKSLAALRARKGRSAKPFAVMCRDLETVRKYCILNDAEAEILASPQAPIVILQKKPGAALPDELAPGLKTLGVMIPYTPLHLLLLGGPFDLLVMTSGNYSSLPLVKDNQSALVELKGIAGRFLRHNREIVNRCDDSLVRVVDGETHIIRRSRGYVPRPVPVSRQIPAPVVLGVGGEMKNSFCLLKKDQAFMSQYIGEIDTLQGEDNLHSSLLNFQKLLGATPEIVACDMHPGYASARVARLIPAARHMCTQHHHAHFASCLAENGLDNGEAIGVILDGSGYGMDGTLWGFEIITGNYTGFRRLYHLAPVPLPGGEAAIRQPWRTAASYLISFLGAQGKQAAGKLFKNNNLDIVEKIISRGFNSPLSCGCGRLFDAVAAITGTCLENTYEGQAAAELGEKVLEHDEDRVFEPYPYEIKKGILLPGPMLAEIVKEKLAGAPVEIISTRFHNTLAELILKSVAVVSSTTGLKNVVLSGGTWQNQYLFRRTRNLLESNGCQVIYHRQVPANDGGIALGQAMIAHWRTLEKCV